MQASATPGALLPALCRFEHHRGSAWALSYLSYSCFFAFIFHQSEHADLSTVVYFVWAEEGVELILGPPIKQQKRLWMEKETRWVRVLAVSLYGISRKQQY